MDYENHMAMGEIPEYATESDEARKQRIANECERMLQEGDLLRIYLDAPCLEIQRRAIQEAVRKVIDERVVDNYIERAFKRDYRTDDSNFAVWVDLCIRGRLPDYCQSMSAFEIMQSIYGTTEEEIERIVEGKL